MEPDTSTPNTTPPEPATAPSGPTVDAPKSARPLPDTTSPDSLTAPSTSSSAKVNDSAPDGAAAEEATNKRAAGEGVDAMEQENGDVKDADAGKDDVAPPKKKQKKAINEPTFYCHQDHQPHPISTTQVLTCTNQKESGKNKALKTCGIKYCEKCTLKRYGENAPELISSGAAASWTCPSCRGICNCSTCRKKQGLEPTGQLGKVAAEQGLTSAADVLKVIPGARQAAKKATSALSASFGKSGKPMQALTREGSPPAAKKEKGKGKAKKPAAPPAKKVKKAKVDSGNRSDSSLSSLSSESDDEDANPSTAGPSKPKAKAAPQPRAKVSKASSPSVDGAKAENGAATAGTTTKRAQAPRAPKGLAGPPPSHPFTSKDYSSATLPCSDSLLARLHFREFFLRLLPLMPTLKPSSKKVPSPQLARVLSALSDDVLWLWSDNDLAAETVQLVILGGLVELLLREKFTTWTVSKAQRQELKQAKEEIEEAKASGSGKVRDRPWRSVIDALQKSEWIGRGREWRAEWKKLAGEEESEKGDDDAEKEDEDGDEEMKDVSRASSPLPKPTAKASKRTSSSPAPSAPLKKLAKKIKTSTNGKGKAKATDDGDDSDLSSISSAAGSDAPDDEKDEAADDKNDSESDDDRDDQDDDDARSSSASEFSGDSDNDDEDSDADEVDQLASDYDEDAAQEKRAEEKRREAFKKNLFQSKGERRGRFDRETPAEERLALCCGLIDMTLATELVRGELNKGINDAVARQTELRKQFYLLRHTLSDAISSLEGTKPPKPPGNGTSEKVKEWNDACEKIEEEIENAKVQNTKDKWHNLHDQYVNGASHQVRFSPVGPDALGNSYYLLSPPPTGLLTNPTAAATSGFPLHHTVYDDGKKDCPLSFCVVVHGKRPVASSDPTPPLPTDAELAAIVGSSPQRSAKTKGSSKSKGTAVLEKGELAEQKVGASEYDAEGKDEWWIVRGIEEIDALAAWTSATYEFAQFKVKEGRHYIENLPGKTNTAHKTKSEIAALRTLVPSKAELERRVRRFEATDRELSDVLTRFASYVRWKREEAAEETGGKGARRVLRGQEEE